MKTKVFRKKLLKVMEDLQSGKMQPEQARAIVSAANQVHLSIEDEIKYQRTALELKRVVPSFGQLNISGSN